MTETAYKRFDQQLHDTYDVEGREIVKKYIHVNYPHLTAVDNPDKYAVDLCIYREDMLVGYAEVEVRTNWKTENFPFRTLHVPERKTKLLYNSLPTLFFSINEQMTHMFYCKAETVLGSPLVNVPNKYVSNNEHFYDVQVKHLTKVSTGQVKGTG